MKAREVALRVLKEVNVDRKYSNICLKENLRTAKIDDRDVAFATQLIYGTLEKQITIDWIIGKFAKLKRINPWVENILRLGCYQIVYLDRIPDSAACNEAVELSKKYAPRGLHGFVNGVLRNISRNKEKIVLTPIENNPVLSLSLKYSYPVWLVQKWIEDYGIDKTELILKAPEGEEYTTIRVNTTKITKAGLIDLFLEKGIKACNGLYMDEALRVKSIRDIENDELYKQGLYTVQGESSMLVPHILSPAKGDSILDACSAPGGKAAHMASMMGEQGRIIAWDIRPHRVDLIKQNTKRLGCSIINAHIHDAKEFMPQLEGKMDCVLVDAPCSGLGVIHNKPDIKIRIAKDIVKGLTDVQWDILSMCSRYVKPGGVLVYSTCTINPLENENIVYRFIDTFKEYEQDDISTIIPHTLDKAVTDKGIIQILPGRDGIDGFFICKFRRSYSG